MRECQFQNLNKRDAFLKIGTYIKKIRLRKTETALPLNMKSAFTYLGNNT